MKMAVGREAMSRQAMRHGSIAVLTAALLWSTGGLFIKEVSLDAWGVSFWRSQFAALTIFVIYSIRKGSVPIGNEEGTVGWLSPFVIGSALCYATLLVLFVLATKLTTSANAIFLQYTAPIYVLFFEPILTHSKRRGSDMVTVGIAVAAMALFFVGKFDPRGVWGNIAALASGVAFAGYALILKHERATERSRLQIVIVGHVLIALSMGILALLGVTSVSLCTTDFLRLMYLGIFQIGIAYAFFTYGISHIRAIDATLIAMVEPVLNPVWVFLGIGERPTNFAIAGGIIILSLSVIRTLRGSRESVEVETVRSGE